MTTDYTKLMDKTRNNLIAILGEDATDNLLLDCGYNALQCIKEFHPELTDYRSEEFSKAVAEWEYKSLDGVFEYHNMPEEVYKCIA